MALVGLVSLYQPTSLLIGVACLASAVISGVITTWLIRSLDPKSIASVRRLFGLLFVSTLVWVVPVVIGLSISSLIKGAATKEFVFGAFLAWGLELVVINGAFLRSTLGSLVIASIHPVPILLLVMSGAPTQYALPVILGVVVLVLVILFLSRIDRVRTKNGISSLEILRAFLKTWVEHEPTELEAYFSRYARLDSVGTDIVIADTAERRVVMVLPGIHPGPFSPVGSYNLSELIYEKLKAPNVTPIVLHGTGGHERNVPTNRIASDYASSVSEYTRAQKPTGKSLMRGPLRSKVGITNITTIAFGKEVLAIVSNAPYRSDDLDPATVTDASEAATKLGLSTMVVDAHNSVDGEEGTQEKISRDEWEKVLSGTLQLQEFDFMVGAANSDEIGFKRGSDISDGGISVTIFATKESKNVLVSADSNNVVSGLRERVEAEVRGLGMSLLDLCTSDTHKLAARNLTNRGYFALGEQTDQGAIIDCVKKLAEIAGQRLARSDFLITRYQSEVPLIGTASLDDFAALTKSTISLTKKYTQVMIPAFLLLLAITLF